MVMGLRQKFDEIVLSIFSRLTNPCIFVDSIAHDPIIRDNIFAGNNGLALRSNAAFVNAHGIGGEIRVDLLILFIIRAAKGMSLMTIFFLTLGIATRFFLPKLTSRIRRFRGKQIGNLSESV